MHLQTNEKHFSNSESKFITAATAKVSSFYQKLTFKVPTAQKNIVKEILGELITSESDVSTRDTLLVINEIHNIKSALLKLKSNNLISDDFFNNVSQNFPTPHGGTFDIFKNKFNPRRVIVIPAQLEHAPAVFNTSELQPIGYRGSRKSGNY